jgi:hypothetical protein
MGSTESGRNAYKSSLYLARRQLRTPMPNRHTTDLLGLMAALINQAQDLVNDAAIVLEQRCQHDRATWGLPVRFDEHVATNFA